MVIYNLFMKINKIIYNPDYYMVNKSIENFNNRNIDIKYTIQNRKRAH